VRAARSRDYQFTSSSSLTLLPPSFPLEGACTAKIKGMALKAWQYTLAFTLKALAIAYCVYFLAPTHTELGGKRIVGWNARTALLPLGACVNVSIVVFVGAIPKRNALVASLVAGPIIVVSVSDTIWKCSHLEVCMKILGALQFVNFLAGMRKLAARFTEWGEHRSTVDADSEGIFVQYGYKFRGIARRSRIEIFGSGRGGSVDWRNCRRLDALCRI
jgi:hypothetical protein